LLIIFTDELAKQFKDAKVRAVITTPQLLERVRAGLEMTPSAGAPIILTEGQTSKDVIALQDLTSRRNKGAVTPERPDPESLAVLPYSSGTTGVPKGVVINHRNMVTGLCIGNHRDAVSYGVEGESAGLELHKNDFMLNFYMYIHFIKLLSLRKFFIC